MRELIYKNLTKPASNKRDISVEEIVERNGVVSSTKKRSIYFVRGVHHVDSKKELAEWIEKKRNDSSENKKFFHILREYSSADKMDKLVCKMRGSFYIVAGDSVYNIVFVHAIKIDIKQPGVGKCI